MALLGDIERSVVSIMHALVAEGLADSFNMPSVRGSNRHTGEVGFREGTDISLVLRDQPYTDLYRELIAQNMYHVLLPDGGLLQFMYQVRLNALEKHRLAFYPSPTLRSFDADVMTYLQDSVWGHVVSDYQMPVVIRFDYDRSDTPFVPVSHSKSHLTLGQYPKCRIPVSSPLLPWRFAEFVLRNFYNRCFGGVSRRHIAHIPAFPPSLDAAELEALHFAVPS